MKKINLIEWLWKTDSHEKQKPQRFARYAAMLLMLLTLGVGQMWAKVVYYNNAGNSKAPRIHYWGGDTPAGTKWDDDPYMDLVDGDLYSFNLGNHTSCIFRYNDGEDHQTGNLTVPTDSRDYYTGIGWGTYWTTSLLEPVLAGDKIMVYGGELTSWGKYDSYFMTDNGTAYAVATVGRELTININGKGKSWFGVAMIESGTYYQGHWNSGLSCAIADADAGYAYIVRGGIDNLGDYFQDKANNGNHIYKVLKGGSNSPTTSVSTTLGKSSIDVGTSTVSVSTGSAGYSVMDNPNEVLYYLYDGSSYEKVTLTSNNLNVSTLSAGDYKLITVLYDGYIYVKADEDAFKMVSPSGHDITYTDESTGWTYGTKPSAAEKDATVTFVVTPTDGYSVSVSSSDVELSGPNEDYEYTFTMPDNDVEITVSASPKNYAITYSPASAPIGAVYTTTPANADYGSTVNLTIDRWAGYTTNVSVKDEDEGTVTVTNATSRTPSFTMPAKAVTVTVTATKINKPIVYVLETQVAAGSNIENFSAVANTCLFWGWKKNTDTNFYSSSATYGTNVALSDSRVGSYIDEHGNTWYEFVSDQSSFNLETEYGVILRLAASDTKLYESNANGHWVDGTPYDGNDNHSYYKGIMWLVPNANSVHSSQLYTYNPDGRNQASIKSINLSNNPVPPGASITATPSMYYKGTENKAYCWGVYSDAGCTSKISNISFTSVGNGAVEFTVPQTNGTYYLKLTVHSTAACDASIDDEEVVSFTVTTDNMIFFKNTPGWTAVYVYFYYGDGASGYWDSKKGTGTKKGSSTVCSASAMQRIGKTDVYYYQYESWDGHVVAFVDKNENGNTYFDQCQVAYREDFSTCAKMYVPENWIHDYLNEHDSYRTCYYSSNNTDKKRGYWTTYPRTNAGFVVKLYGSAGGSQEGGNVTFTQTGANTYEAEVELNPATHSPYYFDLATCAADNGVSNTQYTFYGNSGLMTVENSINWKFYTQNSRCRLTPTALGNYKFKLLLADDGAVQVSVDYPLAEGDYRLVYSDATHHDHPTRFIRARADGKDTISVWVNKDGGSPSLKVQKCTQVSPSIKWSDYNWGEAGTSAINISDLTAGVYNFYLEQNGSKHIDVKTDKTTPYTGLYYIRANGTDGGWMGYKTQTDNRMTYSYYAEENCDFNYYKTAWVEPAGTNVTFTIACDYSESLSDTLMSDATVADATDLPQAANIRFGWDSHTNTLTRAYISGSTNVADRYLVMIGDAKLLDENGDPLAISGLKANEMKFTDLNNWIYRADIKAIPGAQVKLTADYNGGIQYFIGSESTTETIIGGEGDDPYLMRVTYDFKTNRLVTAWLPDGNEIDKSITLDADMLLIRKGHEAATQITFADGKSISQIHSIYGVLQFDYNDMVGHLPSWNAHAYEYLMYYISFPFEVKVSEIFGVGTMGENWIIQKYNGAKRAKIGWFAETSTFWETLPADSVLHPYEGYLLILDRISFNDVSDPIWFKQSAGSSLYLYFPSASNTIGTINAAKTKTITVPSHLCEIDRPFTPSGGSIEVNHKNTDSHWNVIGTPLFASANATTVVPHDGDEEGIVDLNYYYAWDCEENTLSVEAFGTGVNFKSMHSYMVQYTGDVTFTGAHIVTPALAPRRASSTNNYRLSLQLVSENNKTSRTYVELRENAHEDFQLNEDMYMMRTSNTVDLYSFAGNYDVAANVLPIDDQLVKVGVDVKRAGTYRFTMPTDFSGTVTLIDNLMGTRTNMALGDHEVYLERGVDNNRFLLEININKMPTAIDGADGGSLKDGKAHKFIENGQMYILQNGIIYDAQGRKMK